jgi:hypothetical protein
MLELGQKAITQHFTFLCKVPNCSKSSLQKSLDVRNGSGLVEFAEDYFAGVHKLSSEVVCAQLTLVGEAMRAGCQSLIPAEAVPCPAPALDKVEKWLGATSPRRKSVLPKRSKSSRR